MDDTETVEVCKPLRDLHDLPASNELIQQLSNIAYQLQLPSITDRPLIDELQNVAISVVRRCECPVGSHVDDSFWCNVKVLRHLASCQIVAHLRSVTLGS